jgi:peptidoglycan/LPS O-acetylase OafA/YrhL
MRRVLRIFPLYYLSLILLLILIPKLKFNTIDFSYYINNQWWYWTYLQNWFLALKNFGNNTSALHHFWSLAVEEQFYLIWPWAVLFVKKPKYLLLIMAALLVFIISLRFYLWNTQIKHFNYYGFFTFTRIDGLCIGSMLSILQFKNSKFLKKYFTFVVLGLALFNFIFYFFNRHNQFSFPYWAIVGYTTFGVMFALLVYEIVSHENKLINSILKVPVLVFFGKISYGLYVYHWPVYLLLYPYIERLSSHLFTLHGKMAGIINSCILTIIAIVISVLSYQFFETYFLGLKKKFS